MLTKSNPETAKELLALAQQDVDTKWRTYAALKEQFDAMLGLKSS
jgi:hypothetical protein